MAEIVEANVLQIPSRIEVPSQEAVDRNYDRLALLDVRDCSASSPRDKAMILSKIADVAAFNERYLDFPQALCLALLLLLLRWEGKLGGTQPQRIAGPRFQQ